MLETDLLNAGLSSANTSSSSSSIRKVVIAASVGSVLEWYDFFLYASLASSLAKQFFAGVSPATGFLFALLVFAVGAILRPVGAVVFGRLGDRIGRKKTFLATVTLMGVSTLAVAFLPTYRTVGVVAPLLLIITRMMQGIALGGEFGGAITYVVEHSHPKRRGLNASWVVSTGTIGLILSFAIIWASRLVAGDQFDIWGWRIPFLVSVVFFIACIKIRLKMLESPEFERLQRESRISRAPISEAFLHWKNLKKVMVAFFLCAGATTIFMSSTIYPLYFLANTLHVDAGTVNVLAILAAIISFPAWMISGWLCDRIGRKSVLTFIFVFFAVAVFPVYRGLTHIASPTLAQAQVSAPVTLQTNVADCSFMFNPVGSATYTKPCDIAKRALLAEGISYKVTDTASGPTTLSIGSRMLLVADAERFKTQLAAQLRKAGYPLKSELDGVGRFAIFSVLFLLYICAALVMTPISPALTEMFPTSIRYTAVSAPYHLASGWVGGFLPSIVFTVSALMGNIYAGLWYTVGWCVAAAAVCLLFYREAYAVDLNRIT